MYKRRICAQCGVKEPNWLVLMLFPGRMFKIWSGTNSTVDLCSFVCAKEYVHATIEERDRLARQTKGEKQ